jgi:hypothetical protein
MTTLGSQILAVVTTRPGITTNVLCREEIKVRKADILVELKRLNRGRLLRFEKGERGSKCWYVVTGRGNQFPTCSLGGPAVSPPSETDAGVKTSGDAPGRSGVPGLASDRSPFPSVFEAQA